MGANWSESRVCLRKFLFSCISYVSVRRKDSQGCTADVKDTPPSPKEKRTTRSMNSFDSGVSLKSDQSKAGIILFEDSSPLRDRLRKFLFSGIISCLSVRRKDSQGCTADVKDTPPSPKEMMSMVSMNSFDSGVSLKSDQSKAGMILFQRRNLSQGGDEPGAVV
ncbi:uncharacterized protein LOC117267300 isoform X2 [Epinephelus lanceolatus]